MRIVFMGTPDFSVQPLKALIAAGHDIVAVITREDKPKGRGHEMMLTPVKKEALEHGIEVLQPSKLKDENLYNKLISYNADIFVVVAYGKILPKSILDIPRLGCINIHASLLPAYRGAAPIQWAVIDGQTESGITTMLMDEGLDTGDILRQYKISIDKDETGGSLFDKLAELGAHAIIDTLTYIETEQLIPVKQGNMTTAYASMLTKELGDIEWNKSAEYIERMIRGLTPWPGAYSKLEGKTVKFFKSEIVSAVADLDNDCEDEYLKAYGTIVAINNTSFDILTGSGYLRITELQLEGRKRMSVESFMRGYELKCGMRFIRRDKL